MRTAEAAKRGGTMSASSPGSEPGAFLHPQAMCESKNDRAAHAHLGLRARAARRAHRRRLQHLRSHVHRERRHRRRSRHGEVRRPALGRRAHRGRRLHRPERDVCERPLSAQQAAAGEIPDDDREGGRIDRSQRDAAAGNHDRPRRDGRRRRGRRRIGAAVRRRRRQSGAHRELLRQPEPAPAEARGAHRGGARGQEPRARRLRRAACRGRGSARQARGGRDRRVPAVQGEAILHRSRRAGTRSARPARAPRVPPVPRLHPRKLPRDCRRRQPAAGVPARRSGHRRLHPAEDLERAVRLQPRRGAARASRRTRTTRGDYVRDYEAFLRARPASARGG